MVSKFRRRDHALLVIRAHAILPQVPRRLGYEISLQGFAWYNAGTDPRNHHPDLRRNGRPYCAWGLGRRSCPHVSVDPTQTVAIRCDAADQRTLVAPHPDGVP